MGIIPEPLVHELDYKTRKELYLVIDELKRQLVRACESEAYMKTQWETMYFEKQKMQEAMVIVHSNILECERIAREALK